MKNFSFNRLMQLIKKQWSEERKMYTLSTIALFAIMGVVFTFWIFVGGTTYREETLYILGILGLFITGGIFASTSFASLNNKEKGVFSLAFPASHLEKLLTTLFFNVIVFTLVYAVCFFALKSIAEAVIAAKKANGGSYWYLKADWNEPGSIAKSIPVFIYAFFILQSLFILSSIMFKLIQNIQASPGARNNIWHNIKIFARSFLLAGYLFQIKREANLKFNRINYAIR